MREIQVGKLVGISSPAQWSQVHTFFPKEPGKEGLVVAVSVEGKGDEDLAAFGQELIQRLHERYYGSSEEQGGLVTKLEEAVVGVVREFDKVRVTIAAGVVVERGEKLGLAVVVEGEGKVVLVRRGEVFGIKEGSGSTSGWLAMGDVVVVGTTGLFALMGRKLLKQLDGEKGVEDLTEQLAPALVKGEAIDSGLTAAAAGVVMVVPAGEQVAERIEEVITEGTEEERRRKISVFSVSSVMSVIGGVLGKRRIYLRDEATKKRLVRGLVAGLLAMLLVVSVGLGWKKRQTNQVESRFEEVSGRVEQQLREAGKNLEINPLRARAVVGETEKLIEEYRNSGKLGKREQAWLTETLATVLEVKQEAWRSFEVEPGLFLDLGLVREGVETEVMDLTGDQIVALDRDLGVVVRVGLNKSAAVVGGGELVAGGKWVTAMGSRGFVGGDKGIVEVSLDKKTSAIVVPKDEQWGEVAEVKGFGGNLYVLDKGKSMIWKYPGAESGFGAGQRWLAAEVKPDLSRAVAMAIDGSLWILTETGRVVKYTRGRPETFEILGLEQNLNAPKVIYTDEAAERLYILDRGNERVVVLGKDGAYQEQYRWGGMGEVTDMVVSETEKKILLLAGSKIYEIGLR